MSFSFADGEENQDYDEESAEEDEPPGEEGGGRQARVRHEAQALTLWEEESRSEGQEIVSFAAGRVGETAASRSGMRWLLELESGPVTEQQGSSWKPCCPPESCAAPQPCERGDGPVCVALQV